MAFNAWEGMGKSDVYGFCAQESDV